MKITYGDSSIRFQPEDLFELAYIKQFTCNRFVCGAYANGSICESLEECFLEFVPKSYGTEDIIQSLQYNLKIKQEKETEVKQKQEQRIARRIAKKMGSAKKHVKP